MPSTKKTLIVIMMLIISLFLITQFNSMKLFKGEPVKENNGNPAYIPESTVQSTNKTLRVEVNVSPYVYSKLKELSERYSKESGTKVELMNRDTKPELEQLVEQYQLNQNADVLLVNSEDVKRLAVKGMLLPNEQAAKGLESGTDWITEYTRWNGLTWAVPAYLDPYVMVWNRKVVKEKTGMDQLPHNGVELRNLLSRFKGDQNLEVLKGASDDLVREQGLNGEDHEEVTSNQAAASSSWFVWDERDPYALLSLMWRLGIINPNEQYVEASESLQPVSQELTRDAGEPWVQTFSLWGTHRDLFLPLPEPERNQLWEGLELGRYLFAIVPYSEAILNQKNPLEIEEPNMDSNTGSQWVRSSSYVIGANTELKTEAMNWITYITQRPVQMELMNAGSMLPADRTAYDQLWPPLSIRIPSTFAKGNDSLRAALRRSAELELWSQLALEWLKSNEAETKLVTEWERLWYEPLS